MAFLGKQGVDRAVSRGYHQPLGSPTSTYLARDHHGYAYMAIAGRRERGEPPAIDADAWYSVRESTALVDDFVTEYTLKDYCRRGKVQCKKVGPRRQWHILGRSLLDLRREWELDGR